MFNKDVLSVNPEIICLLIEKAKEFHAKEEIDADEDIENSEYESDWSQILADYKDDLTYLEIKKTIEDLEPDQQVDLLALMYIGREDYDAEQWSAAHKEAKNNLQPNFAAYLLAKPLIASYLEKGLESLGINSNEER